MEATRATEPQSHRDAERRLLRRATEQQSCKSSEMNGCCNSYVCVLRFFSSSVFQCISFSLHAFYLFHGQHGSARSTIKLTRSHLHGHTNVYNTPHRRPNDTIRSIRMSACPTAHSNTFTGPHLHGHGSENIFFFITASVTTKSALRHTVYTTRL
jgi:hypothetical protein